MLLCPACGMPDASETAADAPPTQDNVQVFKSVRAPPKTDHHHQRGHRPAAPQRQNLGQRLIAQDRTGQPHTASTWGTHWPQHTRHSLCQAIMSGLSWEEESRAHRIREGEAQDADSVSSEAETPIPGTRAWGKSVAYPDVCRPIRVCVPALTSSQRAPPMSSSTSTTKTHSRATCPASSTSSSTRRRPSLTSTT